MTADRKPGQRKKLLHLNTVMDRYRRRGGSARKPVAERPLWKRAVDWVAPPSPDSSSPNTEPLDSASAAEPLALDGPVAPLTEEEIAERPTVELDATPVPRSIPADVEAQPLSSVETADTPLDRIASPEDKEAAPQAKGPVRGGAAAAAQVDHTKQRPQPVGIEASSRSAAPRFAAPASVARQEPWIGIDFGNHSCTAGVFGQRFELFPGRGGDFRLPSLVALARPEEVLVGSAALEYARHTGRPLVGGLRLLLGRRAQDLQFFDDGGLALVDEAGEIYFRAHSKIYSVVDMCAMLLNVLRQRACRVTGTQISRAVLAIPATFGPTERAALQAAANDAGLSVMGILTEPSAALLGIGLRGRCGLALVCDFGATFKFSLVEMGKGSFTILAASEDPTLGGEQVDRCLAEAFADRFSGERGVDLREHATAWQRLVLACSDAKQAAWKSSGAALQLELPALSQTMSYWLSRQQVQSQLDPLVDGALQLVTERLDELGQQCPELCVVTGGLAELACVRQRVAQTLHRPPVVPRPSEAVVRGVAFRAAELASASATKTDRTSPRKVGVALKQQVVTLFDSNTPLPAEMRHTLFTEQDGQTDVELSVCLGEGSRRWQVLGQLRFRGLDPKPAGKAKVDLRFELDEDGDLNVSADVEGVMHQSHISLEPRKS